MAYPKIKLLLVALIAYGAFQTFRDRAEPVEVPVEEPVEQTVITPEPHKKFVPLDFTPKDIPGRSTSSSGSDALRSRLASGDPGAASRRGDSQDALSRMQLDNAIAGATAGIHGKANDFGGGSCTYTGKYSIRSRSDTRITASAEFRCSGRGTNFRTVSMPVKLKRFGGSWVAD